jgi:hypothetical protein
MACFSIRSDAGAPNRVAQFSLLLDQDAHLARKLDVEEVPATFLFSSQGQILHRWDGLTRPAVLALSIEKLLGRPLAKTPESCLTRNNDRNTRSPASF